MVDRPIIFSAPMVRALLDGRKTMTRRLAWMKPNDRDLDFDEVRESPWRRVQPGDRLWVRENFWHAPAEMGFDRTHGMHGHVAYSAGHGMGADAEDRARAYGVKQRPSIHMPRWASRLTLTVTAVRVERLQDISEADARAEGMPITWDGKGYEPPPSDPWQGYGRYCFCSLWTELHGKGAWEANPEVVVIGFTVRKGNIDHA